MPESEKSPSSWEAFQSWSTTMKSGTILALIAIWLSLGLAGKSALAEPPRVLAPGKQPHDRRLGALKDLNGYFPFSHRRRRKPGRSVPVSSSVGFWSQPAFGRCRRGQISSPRSTGVRSGRALRSTRSTLKAFPDTSSPDSCFVPGARAPLSRGPQPPWPRRTSPGSWGQDPAVDRRGT